MIRLLMLIFTLTMVGWGQTAIVRVGQANTYTSGKQDFTSVTLGQPKAGSDPGTCVVGETFYNSTSNELKVCAATNVLNILPHLTTAGNLIVPGGISTGGATNPCDGTAGCVFMSQGTAPSGQGTTGIIDIAPTSVTSYTNVRPSAAGTGVILNTNSSNVITQTFVAVLGTGSFIRSAGTLDIASGKTLTVSNTMTQTATDGSTVVFGAGGTVTYTIASGTKALDTDAISSGACDTLATTTATGTASTDTIQFTPNADITGVTGYAPVTTGGLAIYAWPTTNTINWKVCNPTSSSITPGAVTLNYRVVR